MNADLFLNGRPFTIVGKLLDPTSESPLPILRIAAEGSNITLFLDEKNVAALRTALDSIYPPAPVAAVEAPVEVLDAYAEEHCDALDNAEPNEPQRAPMSAAGQAIFDTANALNRAYLAGMAGVPLKGGL